MEGKTILITGATGFLAKLLVEKILRVQPNVNKLYLLIRASDNNSARERFTHEVMLSQLFNVIREKMGTVNLSSLMEEKVFAISGDISYENMGIKNPELREEMYKEIDIIINSAAVTKFYERYDIAMNVNVVGPMNVLKFAKSCTKLKILLHVSTAKEVTIAMKEVGTQRARLHGWPNIYSFTKAMGEMLLGHLKENLQVVIIRPTIITSTYKEPFPGWIEGVRTVDTFIVAYGKGELKFYYGDPNSKLDVIPGDMVVNSILAAVIIHGNQYSEEVVIYHISSSSKNHPLKNSDIISFTFDYFTQNPWVNKDGKTIKVRAPLRPFINIASFRKQVSTHYLPLLKVLKFVIGIWKGICIRLYVYLKYTNPTYFSMEASMMLILKN